jgi:hypothetical protein
MKSTPFHKKFENKSKIASNTQLNNIKWILKTLSIIKISKPGSHSYLHFLDLAMKVHRTIKNNSNLSYSNWPLDCTILCLWAEKDHMFKDLLSLNNLCSLNEVISWVSRKKMHFNVQRGVFDRYLRLCSMVEGKYFNLTQNQLLVQ